MGLNQIVEQNLFWVCFFEYEFGERYFWEFDVFARGLRALVKGSALLFDSVNHVTCRQLKKLNFVFVGLFASDGVCVVVVGSAIVVLLKWFRLIDCDFFSPVRVLSGTIGTNILVFEFEFTVGGYECGLIVYFMNIFFDDDGFDVLVNFVLL